MSLVERAGRTGRMKNGHFEWKLNFTLEVQRRVKASQSGGGGILAKVCHAITAEESTLFIPHQLLNRKDMFEQALDKSSVFGGFHCLLSPTQLKQWMEEKMEEFVESASCSELLPMDVITKIGRQECGRYVLNETIELTAEGEVSERKDYIFEDLNSGHGDHLPLDVNIHMPFSADPGRLYYSKIRDSVPKETFLNMIFIAGGVLKAMHYEQLITKYGRVPTTVVYGECNTGKSFAVEAALALFGADRWIKVQQLSHARSRIIMSRTTLPWTVNDIKVAKEVEDLVNLSYERGMVSNMHKGYKCSSIPVFTCNTPVVAELAQNNREACRLVLVPMNTQVSLSHTTAIELRSSQGKASASIGEMIKLEKQIMSVDIMDMIMAQVLNEIPLACPTPSRVAQSYAMELACAYAFIDWLKIGDLKDDLFNHFKTHFVPAISSFQCGILYSDQRQDIVGMPEFIEVANNWICKNQDQVYSNMAICTSGKQPNQGGCFAFAAKLLQTSKHSKRVIDACVAREGDLFDRHSRPINGRSKWCLVVAAELLPADTTIKWTKDIAAAKVKAIKQRQDIATAAAKAKAIQQRQDLQPQETSPQTASAGLQPQETSPQTTSAGLQPQETSPQTASAGLQPQETSTQTASAGLQPQETSPQTASAGLQPQETSPQTASAGLQPQETSPQTASAGLQPQETSPQTASAGLQQQETPPQTASADIATTAAAKAKAIKQRQGLQPQETPPQTASAGLQPQETPPQTAFAGLQPQKTSPQTASAGLRPQETPPQTASADIATTAAAKAKAIKQRQGLQPQETPPQTASAGLQPQETSPQTASADIATTAAAKAKGIKQRQGLQPQETPPQTASADCRVSLPRKLPFTASSGKLLINATMKRKNEDAGPTRTSQRKVKKAAVFDV